MQLEDSEIAHTASHVDGDQKQDNCGQSTDQGPCPIGQGAAITDADAEYIKYRSNGKRLACVDDERVHQVPEGDIGKRQMEPVCQPNPEQRKYPRYRALPERVACIAQDERNPESETDKKDVNCCVREGVLEVPIMNKEEDTGSRRDGN